MKENSEQEIPRPVLEPKMVKEGPDLNPLSYFFVMLIIMIILIDIFFGR